MQDAGVFARESDRLGRAVQVGVASGRVIAVEFPADLPPDAGRDHPVLDRIVAYLDGDPDAISDVEVALTVPTEHRRVLEATRSVPYGETLSLARLARLAGLDDEDEEDLATAESALRGNPVPLLVPDHRIEGAGATPDEVARRLREIES
jgi:methylated-DNA-[protein]-cysteine S-methyltransferase